jgi:NAD(P)-dependent dehydrogenase (short-subunit alcohol dehydrogenase family)
MTLTLITGGNKGLGYESARRLIELGHTVYIGARDSGRGKKAADELGARFVKLDVGDDASVTAAAAELQERDGHLDVLVNNAGVSDALLAPEDVTASAMQQVYDVNVFGIVRTTHAFLPLLRAAESPVIVNVSSGLGSFGVVTNPDRFESSFATVVYGSSKAAVGMLTVQYAKALPDIKVNVVDPGYTATDINGNSGHQTVTEGTDAIVRLATIGPDGPTGTFSDRHGAVPW